MFEDTTFADYILRLATNAGVFLGQRANPLTGEKSVNLKAAHGSLSLLKLLDEKTQGNLTPEESVLLADTIQTVESLFEQTQALEP